MGYWKSWLRVLVAVLSFDENVAMAMQRHFRPLYCVIYLGWYDWTFSQRSFNGVAVCASSGVSVTVLVCKVFIRIRKIMSR